MMRLLITLVVFLLSGHASADLCKAVKDLKVEAKTNKEIKLYKSLFPEQNYFGSQKYNAFVLECNRKRDATGKTLSKILTESDWSDMKNTLKKKNLPAHFFKFTYKFAGVFPFKMRYAVWKKNGEWQVLIPYRYEIIETIKNRVDLNETHASNLYDLSQIDVKGKGKNTTYERKTGARPVWETKCGGPPTYVKGKAGKYKGKSGSNAHKRDRKNKFIDRGKIEYKQGKKGSLRTGCRVKRKTHLYGEDPLTKKFVKIRPDHWILKNFIAQGEAHWSTPNNFRLHIALKGFNEKWMDPAAKKVLKALVTKKDEYLPVKFASEFMPHHGNQMYKSNIFQPHNFSTMTTDGTHDHEIGHALGLDDEYEFVGKISKTSCQHAQYTNTATQENNLRTGSRTYTISRYTMCKGYGGQDNTIYHYIAISRYLLGEICEKDADCKKGKYCNQRLGINRCLADSTKALGKSCKKNRECKSN
ncbi:MAG: hypothetical protein ACPGQS_10860, partial [Bradymonadia bacterium]